MTVDLRTTGHVSLAIVRALQAELAKQDDLAHKLQLHVMELNERIEQLEGQLRVEAQGESTALEKVVQALCESPT